jgi:hypothetical protein
MGTAALAAVLAAGFAFQRAEHLDRRMTVLESRLDALDGAPARQEPGPKSADAPSDDRLARLEARVKRLTGLIEDLAGRAAEAESAALAEIELAPGGRQELVEEVRQEMQRARSLWDQQLLSERPDPSWSPATVAAIEESFAVAPAFASAHLISAECSATLCRVEVTRNDSGDSEDLSDLEDELLVEWADRLPSASVDVERDDTGAAYIVVYYARKDHDLPRPDHDTR